jgi:hypothetical protein
VSGERSPHQTASLKRLERKVDALAVGVERNGQATAQNAKRLEALAIAVDEDRKATTQNTKRLDAINLNGSAAALKRLADNTDQLLRLAEVAPILVEAVEHERDLAIWWKVTRRFLNPLKPLGALIWGLFATVVGATLWNLITKH